MKLGRFLVFIALAFACMAVSHLLELRGDLTPFAKQGVSAERAAWHIAGLLVLLGALGFFIAAGWTATAPLRRR